MKLQYLPDITVKYSGTEKFKYFIDYNFLFDEYLLRRRGLLSIKFSNRAILSSMSMSSVCIIRGIGRSDDENNTQTVEVQYFLLEKRN